MTTYRVPKGVFWADYIKTLKDRPDGRLQIAREYLPLPAAFREAAIALRALIRDQRKKQQDSSELLHDLYVIAAQESLLLSTPQIEGIGTGFSVAGHIPRKTWESLKFPYNEIGYEKLNLLNATDKKWIVEAWGEPKKHLSAQDYHSDTWLGAIQKTRTERGKRDTELQRELHFLRSHQQSEIAQETHDNARPSKSGCALLLILSPFMLTWIALIVVGAV